MIRALFVLIGLSGLVALKLLGDALPRWLGVSVPGSFWGFLLVSLVHSGVRSVPMGLSSASTWMLKHLTLFLPPSLATAAVFLTGLFGALLTPWVPRRAGVVDDQIHAFALGASVRAIGLVRAHVLHPAQPELAVAGICDNTLVTALLCSLFLF